MSKQMIGADSLHGHGNYQTRTQFDKNGRNEVALQLGTTDCYTAGA